MPNKRTIPLYPIFFAFYPILFLFVHNLTGVSFSHITRSLSITVGFTVLLFTGLGLLLKDSRKGALVTTICLILFFSYGHLFEFIRGVRLGGEIIGRNRYLLPVYSLSGLAGIIWAVKSRRNLEIITHLLNFCGGALILLVLINLGIRVAKIPELPEREPASRRNELKIPSPESKRSFPDIYYIILDMYARADILDTLYHYDNSSFISSLEDLGFYVAKESVSNYPMTCFSLPSSLNFDYFSEGKSYQIKHNKVFHFLKNFGYTIVCFATGYSESDIKDADVYLRSTYDLNEFENILIGSTLLRLFPFIQNEACRQRTLYIFDQLEKIPREVNSPKFVFAHILPPHYPYVFDRNGKALNQLIVSLKSGPIPERYIDQLIFVNKKAKEVITKILSRSPTPPIIILQSDHGPDSEANWSLRWTPASRGVWDNPSELFLRERMSNLNAYYLPGDGKKHLYKSITPVNTFRIVFNHYFGGNYKKLKDISYWMDFPDGYEKPLSLVPIEEKYLKGILRPDRIKAGKFGVKFE